MKSILTTIIFCLISLSTFAAPKQSAGSAYAAGNYNLAAQLYEKELKQGVSPVIFYNLGNAYYRMNNLPKAILNYSRSLKYEPGMEEAAYNRDICTAALNVTMGQPREMFFLTWAKNLIGGHSVDVWGAWALGAFVLFCILLIVLYLFRNVWLRRACAVLTFATLVIFCFSLTAAIKQNNKFGNEKTAVVMADVQLTAENNGKVLKTLKAGTIVGIIDQSPDGKILIETTDKATRGWVEAKGIEIV